MTLLVSLAIVLPTTTVATGGGVPSPSEPHPAVVRVIAPESDGVSYGSGTLVAVRGEHGLVVTNWHVVRTAAGQIVVAFPDGFRSAATVMATDPDWDLAALAIWRPGVDPIRLSSEAPRPGEPLTIAGYGSGRYRAITGRCTQYVAPGRDEPFEMVELSAAARQGDSGGPILNRRGELAGVLFGSASGCTTGSYCGRVRWFLAKVTDQFRQMPAGPAMLAAATAEPAPPDSPWVEPSAESPAERPPAPVTVAIPARPPPPGRSPASGQTVGKPVDGPPRVSTEGWDASPSASQTGGLAPSEPAAAPPLAHIPTRLDQIKSILAAIGLVALLFHGLRVLSAAQGS